MAFVLPTPTLQHLAAVNIVGQLWNQRTTFIETAELISEPYVDGSDRQYSEEWKKIVDTVKGKASVLPLPETIKKLLQNFVHPLGIEILNWFERNRQQRYDLHPFRNFLPEQICWTFLGTVDYKKTAQLMIKDEELDVEKRYKIACANCLEEDIRRLIERIPEDRKQCFFYEAKYLGTKYHRNLVSLWTCTVSGNMDRLNKFFLKEGVRGDDNINQYLLKCALSFNNRIASEYFFDKLSQNGKGELLVKLPMQLKAIASCLFRRLSETQQEELLEENNYLHILDNMICWPNQSLFLKTAMRFMAEDGDFVNVLCIIVHQISRGYSDYNYHELYREFWHLNPDDVKSYFLDTICPDLLEGEDEKLIKVILDEFTSLQFNIFLNSDTRKPTWKDIFNVVSDETLNGWKRKITLECENERDEERRSKGEKVLRIFNSFLEDRRRRIWKRGVMNRAKLGKMYRVKIRKYR